MKERLGVFAASAAFLAVGCHWHLEFLDEGSWSYGAWLVSQGALPYRDFMLIGTPAHLYVLGLGMKLFGASLLLERVWQVMVWAAVFTTFYSFLVPVTGRAAAAGGWGMAIALVGRFPHLPGPVPSAILFALLASTAIMADDGKRWRPWVSGAAAGISILFRQDIGVYAAAAIGLMSLIAKRPRDAAKFSAGLIAVMVPPSAYLMSQMPPALLAGQLVGYAATLYPSYGALPFPEFSPETFLFYFPPLMLVLGAAALSFRWKRLGAQERRYWTLSLILTVLFFLPLRFRADAPHLVTPFVAACLVWALLVGALGRWKRAAGWSVALMAVLFLVQPVVWAKGQVLRGSFSSQALDMPRARGIELSPRPDEDRMFADYEDALKYVRSMTRPDERIFVGSVRHDRVCYADPLFYFLAERESATRHHEMHRGVANGEEAQREIIRSLEEKNVRVVVLRRYLDVVCQEPNASAKPGGSTLLDEHIRSRYRLEKEFGGDSVWTLR